MNVKKISDITLERYLLKELDKSAMAEIEAELNKNPPLNARLQALRESTEKILSQYDPHYLALTTSDLLEAGSHEPGFKKPGRRDTSFEFSNPVYDWFHKRRHALSALFFAVVVMTAIILVLPPNVGEHDQKQTVKIAQILQNTDTTRLKGDSLKLFIYRNQNLDSGDVEMLSNNTETRKGDLIQIAFYSAKESYGMIFSLDGRGELTLHYPQMIPGPMIPGKGQTLEKLPLNEKVLLPTSYELDDAPGYEQFFLVASNKKIPVDEILDPVKEQVSSGQFEKNKSLKLDPSLEVESLLLKKVK